MKEGSSVSLLSPTSVRQSSCNVHSNGPNEVYNDPPSEDIQMNDANMTMIFTFTQKRSQFDPVIPDLGFRQVWGKEGCGVKESFLEGSLEKELIEGKRGHDLKRSPFSGLRAMWVLLW